MIKIENVDVYGWEAAIRGMRNPLNSWNKSDSKEETLYSVYGHHNDKELVDSFDNIQDFVDCISDFQYGCDAKQKFNVYSEKNFCIGKNDMQLAKQLVKAGTDHSKFMRMITVTFDITAPMYWWAEMDTYKIGTVRNSCSKMHRLMAKPFEMNDFSFDKLPGYKKEVNQFRPEADEETERWKKVDADYDVSNQGRIRHGSRILSGSLHNDGYIYVTLHGKQQPLHRVIAKTFLPNPGSKPEVNHKDGNKQNNFIENLEWVTRSENQKHAIRNGLQPKNIKTYTGKFTKEQRENIKKLWDGGMAKRDIARKFEVSHTCINDIVNDKYKYAEFVNIFEEVARPIVDTMNELRDSYLACNDDKQKKVIWYSILQLLPSSYNQRSTVQLNYAVLRNIYHSRKAHKLDEWRDFCKWIEELPYSELITMEGQKGLEEMAKSEGN